MSLKILKRDVMPDGTKIQFEKWDDSEYIIGAYPIAMYGNYWIHPGETMRLTISRFKSNDDVVLAYEDLKSGAKTISDFQENFWYINRDRFYLGLMPMEEMRHYDARTDSYDPDYYK